MQVWIDIGKRMRADRLKRKEHQRVAASRMGVTLKEYSDMEAGRISNEHI
jgi:transcriptional regulator with XRE-family HTH domain